MSDPDSTTRGDQPKPTRRHTVTIAFSVLARSGEEASLLVRDWLPPDLAAPEPPTPAAEQEQGGPAVLWWTQVPGVGPRPRETTVPPPGWEAFEDSGIPEMVVQMFPRAPRLADYRMRDGSFDHMAFDDAGEQWRARCLDLAAAAPQLPQLLQRLEVAERLQDGIFDLVERAARPGHDPGPPAGGVESVLAAREKQLHPGLDVGVAGDHRPPPSRPL